jgi:hypothetical protein
VTGRRASSRENPQTPPRTPAPTGRPRIFARVAGLARPSGTVRRMPNNERTSVLAASTAAALVTYVVYIHVGLEAAFTLGLMTWAALYVFLRL